MHKLTLVWQHPKEQRWQEDWIEYIFRNVPHDTIDNLDHSKFINNSVIIDAICWAPYHNDYITKLSSTGYNFGLIHVTDESTRDDISSYQNCKFVLRNYYRGEMGNNIMHFPLGWNTGFTDVVDNKSASERKYTWSFVGERWDPNRNEMVSQMSKIPGGHLYVAKHHGPRLTPTDMSKIYRETIFVPCPRGAISMDNFRVTEALEAGCIPIVERNDYWTNMHGADFPAIQINSWAEVPAIIQQYILNPTELDNLRNQCYNWWTVKKNQVTEDVTNLVTRTML